MEGIHAAPQVVRRGAAREQHARRSLFNDGRLACKSGPPLAPQAVEGGQVARVVHVRAQLPVHAGTAATTTAVSGLCLCVVLHVGPGAVMRSCSGSIQHLFAISAESIISVEPSKKINSSIGLELSWACNCLTIQ